MFLAVVKYCVLELTPPSLLCSWSAVHKTIKSQKCSARKFERQSRTFVAENDGNRDHNHSCTRPNILHQKLLKHNVPQSLRENGYHLVADGFVGSVQVIQLNLMASTNFS